MGRWLRPSKRGGGARRRWQPVARGAGWGGRAEQGRAEQSPCLVCAVCVRCVCAACVRRVCGVCACVCVQRLRLVDPHVDRAEQCPEAERAEPREQVGGVPGGGEEEQRVGLRAPALQQARRVAEAQVGGLGLAREHDARLRQRSPQLCELSAVPQPPRRHQLVEAEGGVGTCGLGLRRGDAAPHCIQTKGRGDQGARGRGGGGRGGEPGALMTVVARALLVHLPLRLDPLGQHIGQREARAGDGGEHVDGHVEAAPPQRCGDGLDEGEGGATQREGHEHVPS